MQGLPQFLISGLPDAACKQSPGPDQGRRGELRACRCPTGAGRSTCRRRRCPRAAAASTCRSRSPCSPRRACCRRSVVAPMVHIGELGLDGSVRPVRGVLPAVMAAARLGVTSVVVPADNAAEAALVPGMRVLPARHLSELVSRYRLVGTGRGAAGRAGRGSVGRPNRSPCPTCVTSWARTRRGWRWRSRRRVGTTCSWSARRAPARRCWPSGCPGLLPALEPGARPGGHGDPVGAGGAAAGPGRWCPAHRSSRRTTVPRWRRSSAVAAASSAPARSPGRTAACCSSTRGRSSSSRCCRRCGSRPSPAR